MKAIFAVSALAAAISAQAIAADTEATTTFSGEINYNTWFDLEAENRFMTVVDGEDETELDMSISVANGGFSGSLSYDAHDDDWSIGDLQYSEGAFLFGQGVGSIVSTEASVGNMSDDVDYDAGDAFRYTSDFGLTVQAEAGNTYFDNGNDDDDEVVFNGANAGATATGADNTASDLGIAVAYMADLDVATVTVDAQYREAVSATDGNDTMIRPYVGAKVVASPVDMVTVTAGATMGGAQTDKVLKDDQGGANTTSYGVQADVTVMEGVTAMAYYSANVRDGVTDNEAKVSATATFAPLTVTASHAIQLEAETATTEASATLSQDFEVADGVVANAHAEASWETDTDVDWSAGADVTYAISEMMSAYAGYEVNNAGDDSELTAGVIYTTEGGAEMKAAYRNASADYDDDGIEHTVKLSASYSF
jgi:hypothetical protein